MGSSRAIRTGRARCRAGGGCRGAVGTCRTGGAGYSPLRRRVIPCRAGLTRWALGEGGIPVASDGTEGADGGGSGEGIPPRAAVGAITRPCQRVGVEGAGSRCRGSTSAICPGSALGRGRGFVGAVRSEWAGDGRADVFRAVKTDGAGDGHTGVGRTVESSRAGSGTARYSTRARGAGAVACETIGVWRTGSGRAADGRAVIARWTDQRNAGF